MEKLTEWELGIRQAQFEVFNREWWKPNPSWPDGREPHIGDSHHIGFAMTREQAVEMCKEWNENHDEGDMSDKAEFKSMF